MFFVHGKEEAGEHDGAHQRRRKARPGASCEQKEKRQAHSEGRRKANDLPLRQIEGDFRFYFRQVFGYGYIRQAITSFLRVRIAAFFHEVGHPPYSRVDVDKLDYQTRDTNNSTRP